jgi:hypothetical protein
MTNDVAEEMMATREGRSLRDTLSKDLVVVSQSVSVCVCLRYS